MGDFQLSEEMHLKKLYRYDSLAQKWLKDSPLERYQSQDQRHISNHWPASNNDMGFRISNSSKEIPQSHMLLYSGAQLRKL
jgi:hypothetical protein